MKVKSLFAASLAAMSLFSCSNEIEDLNSGANLAPGDAMISIDLGGKTTYSTEELETKIHNGHARLFTKAGAGETSTEIKLTDLNIDKDGKKFTAKILADDFVSGTEANLYFYINSNINTSLTEEFLKVIHAGTPLDRGLSGGIPATSITPVTLTSGSTVTSLTELKRSASRIGAVAAEGYKLSDLNGYAVTISNYSTNGFLFATDTQPFLGADGTAITINLDGDAANMYKGSETVGYIYPSEAVEVVVAKGSETRRTSFTAKAGKNYILKIKPKPQGSDGNFDWDIAIEDWETVDGGEVDFSRSEKATVDLMDRLHEYCVKGGEGIVDFPSGISMPSQDLNDFVLEGTNNPVLSAKLVSTSLETIGEVSENNPLSVTLEGINMTVNTLAGYSGSPVTRIVELTFKSGIVRDLHIRLNPKAVLPEPEPTDDLEAVLISMGGNRWMPFNTSGDYNTDLATASAILETEGATIAEKVVNYAYAGEWEQYEKVSGHFFLGNGIKCPTGYRVASVSDYENLGGAPVPNTGETKWLAGTDYVKVDQPEDLPLATFASVTKELPENPGGMHEKKLNWYWTMTNKETGKVLPFIGCYTTGQTNTNNIWSLSNPGHGFALFTGDRSGSGHVRVSFYINGVNRNVIYNGKTDISYVRCVKQ